MFYYASTKLFSSEVERKKIDVRRFIRTAKLRERGFEELDQMNLFLGDVLEYKIQISKELFLF